MRALSMLGAGAQPWSVNVCTVHRDRLAYSATLAIYIYQREGVTPSREWRLRAILSEHPTAVSALAWHPARASLLATAAADLRVCVWCVKQQHIIATFAAPSEPTLLEWNPFEREMVTFVHLEGRALLTWTAQEGNTTATAYRDHSNFSSAVLCLTWHPTKPGKLAFGHADGSLSFYDSGGGVQLHMKLEVASETEGAVCALQWDPLAEDYLLVAHAGAGLHLIAVKTPVTPMTLATFRHPAACRARCVAWLPECPGMFVTGDEDSGVVRVWTVGRDTFLENRSLQDSGLRGLLVVPGHEHNTSDIIKSRGPPVASASLACVFSNGGLGVYDLKRASWELHKEAGHTETVFTCAFRPDDSDILATGSFDGSVKFWSCSRGELELEASTSGRESIIYSVSWAPPPLTLLAVATARSGLLIVDTAKARVTQRIMGHGAGVSVYCAAWCQADARRVASGGADGTCLITQHRGEIEVQRCKHPGPVFGCDWQGRDMLATGCEDGNVRVFKVTCNNNGKPIVLSGHTAKVFNVRWNPVQTGLLVSGSDDGNIRVWDSTTCTCLRELEGHSGPVRGLVWCPAVPHVLVSGSWDFTVRVWDVRHGVCLALEKDHGADVYGLTIHPMRPLLLASCSRDSTVRLWTLAPLVTTLGIRVLLSTNAFDDLIAQDFNINEESPVRLCGSVASYLETIESKKKLDDIQKFLAVINTINADPSVQNLWDLIAVLRGTTELSQLSRHYTRGIVHSSHVATCHLHTGIKASLWGDRRNVRTEIARSTLTCVGGTAIAVDLPPQKVSALPMLCLSWTKQIVYVTADGTRREMNAKAGSRGDNALREAAESFLRAGALRRYCELMTRLGEWDQALAVAPGVSLRYWRILTQRRAVELYESDSERVIPHALARGDIEGLVKFYAARGQLKEAFTFSSLSGCSQQDTHGVENEEQQPLSDITPRLMITTARALTERYLQGGFPIHACCVLLAVNDVKGALHMLLRGHELELVVAVGRALNHQNDPRVHRALVLLALRARRLSEWKLASRLLQLIDNTQVRQHEVLRMLVRFPGTEKDRSHLHQLAELPDAPECASRAHQLLATSGGNLTLQIEATRLLLAAGQADQALSIGLALLTELLWPGEQYHDPEESLKLVELLQETGSTSPLLKLLSAYMGCLIAVRRRYAHLVKPMVEYTRSLMQEAIASGGASCGLREDALQALLSEGDPLVVGLRTNDDPEHPDRGIVYVAGCQLPAHSALRRCIHTGQPIRGPAVAIDKAKEKFMALSDAIMWAKTGGMTPFGETLNPF